MTDWHTQFIRTGRPRGIVQVFVYDERADAMSLRGTLDLTKAEYEELAARLAGGVKELLAALERLVDQTPLPAVGRRGQVPSR